MPTFFYVDRREFLTEGGVVDLSHHNDLNPRFLQGHVDQLFPNGVTQHGNAYFLNGDVTAQALSPNVELIYEYVRRAEFPDAPSRFESVFACESLEDARSFRDNPVWGRPGAPIWKVETPHEPFRADMTLLALLGSILVVSYRAHRYWHGLPNDIHEFPSGLGQPAPAPVTPFWELLLTPPVTAIERVE